jgi:hypothetical protein
MSESTLRRLDFLFAGDTVLERALEAVDVGAVHRLEAPSGRCMFQVISSLAGRRGFGGVAGGGAAAATAAPDSSVRYDLAASGIRDGAYSVLLDGGGVCSCYDFSARVLHGGRGRGARRFVSFRSLPPPPLGRHIWFSDPAFIALHHWLATFLALLQCKHLLAAALADALGRCKSRVVSEEALAKALAAV